MATIRSVSLSDEVAKKVESSDVNFSKLVNDICTRIFFNPNSFDEDELRVRIDEQEKIIKQAQFNLGVLYTQLGDVIMNNIEGQALVRELWLKVSFALKMYWEHDEEYPLELIEELANALNIHPRDVDGMYAYDLEYRDNHPFEKDWVEVHNDVYLLLERYKNDF